MEKVFEAELSHPPGERSEASATLSLPATPYELRDALDKLRIQKGRRVSVEILSVAPDVRFLTDYINRGTCDVPTLHLLNALAEKIARMNPTERRAFEGMVLAELEKNSGSIPAAKLYDLASSVDRCHVVDVSDDESLGRFYVDGGFLPEYGNLPERILENLNYAKIGAEAREGEGGVFVPGDGYVVQREEFAEASKDFVPEEPDYSVLLELRQNEETALWKLPSAPEDLIVVMNVMKSLGAKVYSEISVRCADCRIPALRDAIDANGDIAQINNAARILRDLPDERCAMYKAVLDARGFSDLGDALDLTKRLDEYTFTPSYTSPEDVALSELRFMLPDEDAERLIPFVNLYNYGRDLIKNENLSMTPYGAIERRDRKPVRETGGHGKSENGNNRVNPRRKYREPSR